jgi:hypothetical protein
MKGQYKHTVTPLETPSEDWIFVEIDPPHRLIRRPRAEHGTFQSARLQAQQELEDLPPLPKEEWPEHLALLLRKYIPDFLWTTIAINPRLLGWIFGEITEKASEESQRHTPGAYTGKALERALKRNDPHAILHSWRSE